MPYNKTMKNLVANKFDEWLFYTYSIDYRIINYNQCL